MKILLIIGASLLALSGTSYAAPLEKNAQFTSDLTRERAQAIANDASYLIKRAGYKCDTVSYVAKWVFSVGFDVKCNHNRYAYEITDKGGNWVATLK